MRCQEEAPKIFPVNSEDAKQSCLFFVCLRTSQDLVLVHETYPNVPNANAMLLEHVVSHPSCATCGNCELFDMEPVSEPVSEFELGHCLGH